MFLHEDRELFQDIIEATAEAQQRPIAIIEKDYYVTMILKLLSEEVPACVFKGGTSLSKCHHAIDRFSEDIDIAFSENLTQGQRKRLKNNIISGISRRDYNCYTFAYQPIGRDGQDCLLPGVKMEISLGTISFPTIKLPVDSYLYHYLLQDNDELIEEFHLQPFEMNLQSLERTFADKVFAICDYYMAEKLQRNSRHIYDLYMLFPRITFNDEYKKLISEIRVQRARMPVCLSAQEGVNIPELLKNIVKNEVYRSDYEEITAYFQNYPIEYQKVICVLDKIIESKVFE